MTRRPSALAAAMIAALGACTADSGMPFGPLAPIRTVQIGWNVLAVAGHGDVVAVLHYPGSGPSPFEATLRLARQEATVPAELLDLGDLALVGATVNPVDDLVVTDDWVTLCSGGTTTVVSLTRPAPELVATFATGEGTRAIASGRWLLIAQGTSLSVRDLESPDLGFPQVGGSMLAGAPVTGLAAVPGGFYVFTNAGFGHVSIAADQPAYEHVASDALRLFSKAFLHGTKLYAGGRSPFAGKVRVARIDVSTSAAPVLEAFAELEAAYGDFAYDGAGVYSVLGQTADYGLHTLTVFRDSGGAIARSATRDLHVLRGDTSISHASRGVLYAPNYQSHSSTSGDLALYALP